MSFKAVNVFDLLPNLPTADEKYDYVILDPPAFTKSRATVDSAIRGYKEINLRAMKLLPRGGYLATCSCSHFMTDELFRTMLKSAAFDAHVELRQIELVSKLLTTQYSGICRKQIISNSIFSKLFNDFK